MPPRVLAPGPKPCGGNNILQSLDRGGFTGTVFLDLSKAFDTVTMCFLSKNSRPSELVLKL